MSAHFLILLSIICISQIGAQNTINCGETKTGIRKPQQEVHFDFTAQKSYNQVYLEGCESKHDIWLQIAESYGNVIADADDANDHGIDQDDCKNQYAGDITIPGSVQPGQKYTFIVKGFENAFGFYSVTLYCDDEEASIDETTTTSNPPVTSTTTTTTTTTTETPTPAPTAECNRHREPWYIY